MTFAHDLPFDPTYGYDLDGLLQIAPPPAPTDFERFWTDRYRRARDADPAPVLRPSGRAMPDRDVYDVQFSAVDGVRITAWLTLPRSAPIRRGIVVSHGYGGRVEPDIAVPMADAAALFVCSRGLPSSQQPPLPDTSDDHVIYGLHAREEYIFGGCAADVWAAASALLALVPQISEPLAFSGGSFGGGLGAIAVPWDDRFGRAHLQVPSFGHHPLRLQMPCLGSGESVRRYVPEHPEAVEVLRYFDAAITAGHFGIPVHVAPALFDPSVPPPGQFAVYNAIRSPKALYVLQAGHFDYPDGSREQHELWLELADFFNA